MDAEVAPPMLTHRLTILCLSVLLVACSREAVPDPPATARSIIDDAVRAIGGRSALEAARTLIIEGEGEAWVLGQGRTAHGESIKYRVTGFRRSIDLAGGRWRQEQLLTPLFAVHYPEPRKEITALDGDVTFDVGEDGTTQRATDPDARIRRLELHHTPVAVLRAALAPRATVGNRRRIGAREAVDVRIAGGAIFTVTFDPRTRLPASIASRTDQTPLGDVVLTTELADYEPAGELVLPTRIAWKLDRYPLAAIRVSKNTVDGDVGDLAAPAAVKAAPAAPEPPRVVADELAPGVWLLAGEGHHSALVEFADHLRLIEAPLSEARTRAAIARARQLRPTKPLTHVIVTHHHFDHSAGVRAAVAEGLTVVVHEKNERFVEELVARPHTIEPDLLARRPRRLAIEAVGARTVQRDSMRTMELHAVDSEHAEGMLAAYLPAERLLIEVDLYTPFPPEQPPPPRFPFAGALVELVRSQRLEVDRVVPLHRGIAPLADLLAAAQKGAPPRRAK
jgi:glyoxylase-like metal-dependent hydrolase (beta-lactamase superfamily II)